MSGRLKPKAEPASLASQILPTESAPDALPAEAQRFIASLVTVHGSVRLAQETSGTHVYLACPQCLQTEGESELHKKHLALNLDKYLAGSQRAVLCMKCGFVCEAVDLQFMPPLLERGIEHKPEVVKIDGPKMEYLETDEHGLLVPKNPGEIVPVNQLLKDHPARQYLASRKFSAAALWTQFQCSWCETENQNLFYRRLPGGFRITPQGRLIFFCLQAGSKMGWQARILEFDEDDKRYFWHPYKKEWIHVLNRAGDKWVPREGYEEWDPAKYWTAPGTRRNSVVMGLDAAMEWNLRKQRMQHTRRVCILVEGPLDAGRLGPPAMAIMGKALTADQAILVAKHFYRIILIADNDKAGEKLKTSAARHFANLKVRHDFLDLPTRFKDAGSLDAAGATMFLNMALNKADCL